MNFSNEYLNLGEVYSRPSLPAQVKSPKLLLWNEILASQLGFRFKPDQAAQYFSGNEVITGSKPIAMAYSGHQFGQFNPHLGDGRAHLLGEVIDNKNQIQEIQLKGSGQTPFSRNGDGKCGIKPAVREYIMSEAMHALGVPTTRCLAVVATGEDIYRQTSTPGAVLTRVATSHLRVGTFEYFAARGMHDKVKALVELTINRHYPEIDENNDIKYIQLISHVIDKQIDLIINWMRVGFIHGVMNTDNTLLSGYTIDYGPCAMLGVYDPETVFSSIDRQGRYAYGNQPWIAQWNMARFAETLIPLIADGGDEAIKLVAPLIEEYSDKFKQAFSLMLAQKLGFKKNSTEVADISHVLLDTLLKKQLDYTETFNLLTESLQSGTKFQSFENEALSNWHNDWLKRLRSEGQTQKEANRIMRKNNPLVIPRNHHIEIILDDVEQNLTTDAIDEFLQVLKSPYSKTPKIAKFQDTNPNSDLNYQTFCGT